MRSRIVFTFYFLAGFVLLIRSHLHAQNTFRMQGIVIDQETQEPLIGAIVYSPQATNPTTTDSTGRFVLQSEKEFKTIKVKYVAFEEAVMDVSKLSKSFLKVSLKPGKGSLQEVVIESSKENPTEKINQVQMGVDKISMKEAKLLPAIFGEVDIIKILQLKPGVKSGGEGTAGFFVRGGSSDQNLILVENAPVYNPNHLFGFFSVFNSDAIKDVTLYKSGFPAEYGGRLSSVLDVKMRKSQADSFELLGGIGLISSRLSANIPIIKNKVSLLVSGRRTYVDLITNSVNKLNEGKEDYSPIPAYFFYDFNTVLDYKIDAKNDLSLNGYFGNDVFKFDGENFGANLFWGNRSGTLDWKHKFNSRLQVSNAWFTSGYLYKINNQFAENSLSLGSRIWDQGFVSNWKYDLNQNHHLQFGASGIYHRFTVGEFGLSTDFTDIKQGEKLESGEMASYIAHEWHLTKRLDIVSGLRNSTFVSKNKTYNGIEPRLATKYNLTPTASLKTSYSRMYQYLHLVSSSTSSLPTDVWYPSEAGIKPQISDQVSLGLHKSLSDNQYFASVEGYYKWIHNAIDFKDGAQLFSNPELEKEFVFGKGWAYGFEAYIEKKKGRTTGWIGYTLAWTWRQFKDINYGEAFHPRYDRRHDISVVVMHKLSKRLSLSGTWIYGTEIIPHWLEAGLLFRMLCHQNWPPFQTTPNAMIFNSHLPTEWILVWFGSKNPAEVSLILPLVYTMCIAAEIHILCIMRKKGTKTRM